MEENKGRLFINTYRPLVFTKQGRESSDRFGLPPFVDGSIRREPDLEHPYPAISCLCRTDKFTPRLRVNDVVVYMTVKGNYGTGTSHWRLTGVLRVSQLFTSHREAADWYLAQGMTLPNNCLVEGNAPFPISHSHGRNWNKGIDLSTALNPENWRVPRSISDKRFAQAAEHVVGRFVRDHMQRFLSWTKGTTVQGLLLHDFHVRDEASRGWGLEAFTGQVELSPFNQRRRRQFQAFITRFDTGLSTPPFSAADL